MSDTTSNAENLAVPLADVPGENPVCEATKLLPDDISDRQNPEGRDLTSGNALQPGAESKDKYVPADDSLSHPGRDSHIKGRQRRAEVQAPTIADVLNRLRTNIPHLTPASSSTPSSPTTTPLFSSLFPASFVNKAPPSGSAPSNQDVYDGMTDSAHVLKDEQKRDPTLRDRSFSVPADNSHSLKHTQVVSSPAPMLIERSLSMETLSGPATLTGAHYNLHMSPQYYSRYDNRYLEASIRAQYIQETVSAMGNVKNAGSTYKNSRSPSITSRPSYTEHEDYKMVFSRNEILERVNAETRDRLEGTVPLPQDICRNPSGATIHPVIYQAATLSLPTAHTTQHETTMSSAMKSQEPLRNARNPDSSKDGGETDHSTHNFSQKETAYDNIHDHIDHTTTNRSVNGRPNSKISLSTETSQQPQPLGRSSTSTTPSCSQILQQEMSESDDKEQAQASSIKEIIPPISGPSSPAQKKRFTYPISPILPTQSRHNWAASGKPSKSSSHGFVLDDNSKTSDNNKSDDNSGSDESMLDAKADNSSDDTDDEMEAQTSRPQFHLSSPLNTPPIYPPYFHQPFFAPHSMGSPDLPLRPNMILPNHMFPYSTVPGMAPEMMLRDHMNSLLLPYNSSSASSVDPARQGDREKDLYFCHLCSYSGKSKDEFDTHMNTHFEFNCPHCDYTSRTEGRLKRHIKDFHSEESSRRCMPGRPKVFKCKQCPFSATERDKFWEHSRTHMKEDKLLQCPKCAFVTEYKHHLEYHLRNHMGSKPFSCTKCNYSCVNKSMLNSHMKSHTNVYQYRCSDCSYASKYCHSLKLHLKKYNHKPAKVLNQDGSIPQGLDAEASGLPVSKSGSSQGSNDLKDKNDTYFNMMFPVPSMPLGMSGMNPMLGAMMPFWSMLPQMNMPGYPPPQSSPLPGSRHLIQQMGIGAEIKEDSIVKGSPGKVNERISQGSSKQMVDDLCCRLCNFTSETLEALCLHLVQVHKKEVTEVAKHHGISDTFLTESVRRFNMNAEMNHRQHLPDPVLDSYDKEARSFPAASSDSLHTQIAHKLQSSNILSRSLSSCSENDTGMNKLPDMYSHESVTETHQIRHDSNSGIDSLQQITLKYRSDILSGKKSPQEVKNKSNRHESTADLYAFRSGHIPKFTQNPLDLTKDKHMSSTAFSSHNSPVRPSHDDQIKWVALQKPDSANEARSLSKVAEMFLKKQSVSELESSAISSGVTDDDMSRTLPRKRSRKGKAYKLDTICMKLQKKQARAPLWEDESDPDTDRDHFTSWQATETEQTDKTILNCVSKAETYELLKPSDQNLLMSHKTNQMTPQKNTNVSYLEDKDHIYKETGADGKQDHESPIRKNDLNEDSKIKNNVKSDESPGKGRIYPDEAELELQKLHRSLCGLDQELEPGSKTCGASATDKTSGISSIDKQHKTTNNFGDVFRMSSQTEDTGHQTSAEEQMFSDEEDCFDTNIYTKKLLGGEEVDTVNLVSIEKHQKSISSSSNRGTDLPWNMLDEHGSPQASFSGAGKTPALPTMSSTLSHGGTAAQSTQFDNSFPVWSGMQPSPLMPPYSHSSQPHISQSGKYSDPHISQSRKPPSIPPPLTPMACIPPNNRMLPEPAAVPSTSNIKPPQKELFECTYCDLSFGDCVMYTVHMGYHSNQNPFQCNSCGVVSRDKVEFFLHIARTPHG